MSDKILKVTLAARVQPDLKESIYEEATAKKVTPSSYVESILFNRSVILDDPMDEDRLSELSQLQLENEELTAEIEALKLTLEDADNSEEVSALEDTISELESERDDFFNQLTELQSQMDETIIERDEVIETYHQLQSEHTGLKGQFDEVSETGTSIDLEGDFEGGLAESEPYLVDELNKEIDSLKSSNATLKLEVEELQVRLDNTGNSADYKSLNRSVNTLKNKVAGLKDELKSVSAERDELLEKITDLERDAFIFDEVDKEELETYFADLKDRYPTLTTNQIILASLSCTSENEKSTFWITTIKKYVGNKERAKSDTLAIEETNEIDSEEEVAIELNLEELEEVAVEE